KEPKQAEESSSPRTPYRSPSTFLSCSVQFYPSEDSELSISISISEPFITNMSVESNTHALFPGAGNSSESEEEGTPRGRPTGGTLPPPPALVDANLDLAPQASGSTVPGLAPTSQSLDGSDNLEDPDVARLADMKASLTEAMARQEETSILQRDIADLESLLQRKRQVRRLPPPPGLELVANQASVTMMKLVRIRKGLDAEIVRSPSCIDPDSDEQSFETEAAVNLATKAEDKLSEIMFENELLPAEQDLWDKTKDLVNKIIKIKGAKKRDTSIRMPAMEFTPFTWSGKAADLKNWLQRIEPLLRAHHKSARFNYLYQCLRPRDAKRMAHTVDYDEAIKILSKLATNA
ncbi:MAG: hypothetical protein GY830_08465, partial [Bacteroidetes bacterium]|nr:hypothetical protein [Bacteroidota bacterium]